MDVVPALPTDPQMPETVQSRQPTLDHPPVNAEARAVHLSAFVRGSELAVKPGVVSGVLVRLLACLSDLLCRAGRFRPRKLAPSVCCVGRADGRDRDGKVSARS
ncbi:hypothetical protein GCM10027073_21970 [Streptomyces chlorus]